MPIAGPKFGQVMLRAAKAVEQGRTETIKAGVAVAKTEQLAVMRVDSGGDLRLSGVGKNGAAIGVKSKVSSGSLGASSAVVSATGPLPLINNNTPGHVIRRRGAKGVGVAGGRVKRSGFVGPVLPGQFTAPGRGGLSIPGIGVRASARHPGTKGKDTWQRGRKNAEPKILAALGKNMTTILKKAARP